jgi:hypothetical protein
MFTFKRDINMRDINIMQQLWFPGDNRAQTFHFSKKLVTFMQFNTIPHAVKHVSKTDKKDSGCMFTPEP